MEKVSKSAVVRHKGKFYPLTGLPASIELSRDEQIILQARTASLALSQLDPDQLAEAVRDIVLRAVAISGAGLPDNTGVLELLGAEISTFLLEMGYESLSPNEVVLAFRMNARGYSDSDGDEVSPVNMVGKSFNVFSIARVLSQYMKSRILLDKKLQNSISENGL